MTLPPRSYLSNADVWLCYSCSCVLVLLSPCASVPTLVFLTLHPCSDFVLPFLQPGLVLGVVLCFYILLVDLCVSLGLALCAAGWVLVPVLLKAMVHSLDPDNVEHGSCGLIQTKMSHPFGNVVQ